MNPISKTLILLASLIISLMLIKDHKPEKVIETEIHEIKGVKFQELRCRHSICDYELIKNNNHLELKNTSRISKEGQVILYTLKKEDETCLLKISKNIRNKAYINKLYTNRTLYAIQCWNDFPFR